MPDFIFCLIFLSQSRSIMVNKSSERRILVQVQILKGRESFLFLSVNFDVGCGFAVCGLYAATCLSPPNFYMAFSPSNDIEFYQILYLLV